MHIHTMVWVKRTPGVVCEGCGLRYRLALHHEAVWVQKNDAYAEGGPMVFGEHGAVIVPLDFAIPEV